MSLSALARLRRAAPRAALAAPLLLAGRPLAAQNRFGQTNLVSDIPGLAQHLDPDLVNPWGISSSATSPFWVSDAARGITTLYTGAGVKQALVVTIPLPVGGQSEPTGQVFNDAGTFTVGGNPRFLFATTQGTIAGWNAAAGATAFTVIDRSGVGAAYTGLAIARVGTAPRLYAANFAGGAVDAFDAGYASVLGGSAFTDPNLPAGYSPFNVQNLGGTIYVTYALRDPGTGEETAGAGLGAVDAYDVDGTLLSRVVLPGGVLDAPWGLALAPAGFGDFAGALLVGNFGDGQINAFDAATGAFLGTLHDRSGAPIVNDGLWGLRVGNAGLGGDPGTLYFAAGLDDETHGLFGAIAPVPEPATVALEAGGLAILLLVAPRRRRR